MPFARILLSLKSVPQATVVVALVAISGCGEPVASKAPGVTAVKQAAAPVAAPAVAEPDDLEVRVDAAGRKWLTADVPYDVFPGLPTDEEAIAVGRAASEVGAVASTIGSRPSPPPALEPVPRAATEKRMPERAAEATPADWAAILPLEALQNEVASVRNGLNERLLTVGSYNAAFEQVSNDGWLMSALATIAYEHPASFSWKDKALLARDAAVGVAMAATARGRQNFNDAELANEQLVAILNNNVPPGLPEPDPAASREETADRASLMNRMQSAADRLKEYVADAAALQTNAPAASQEARVLAALAKFAAHQDYGSTENDDYQAASAELVSAGTEMAEAAAAEDATRFKSAFDRVGIACNQCHEKYRFAN